jgi:hypothetical protein
MATRLVEHPDHVELRTGPNRSDLAFWALSLVVTFVRFFPEPRLVRSWIFTVGALLATVITLSRRTASFYPEPNRVTTRTSFLGLIPLSPKTMTVNGVHVVQQNKKRLPVLQIVGSGRTALMPVSFEILPDLVRRGVVQQAEVDQLAVLSEREIRTNRLVGTFVLLVFFNLGGLIRAIRPTPAPTPRNEAGQSQVTPPPLASSPLVEAMNITNGNQLRCLNETEGDGSNSIARLLKCAPTETVEYFRYGHSLDIKTASDTELDCVSRPVLNLFRVDRSLTAEDEERFVAGEIERIGGECGLSPIESQQLHDFWLERRVDKSARVQV